MILYSAAILAQIVVFRAFASQLLKMEKLTRSALVLSLKGYGETPPEGWTKVELCARLQELADQGEVKLPTKQKQRTPLEEAVQSLNKAAAKKSDLQAHVAGNGYQGEMGNETMAILQQRAMQHLISSTEGAGEDKLGFGKYASQTYSHVQQYDDQYCRWVMTTAKEGGGCSMYLTRFATWLENNPKGKTTTSVPKVDMNKFVEKKEKDKAKGSNGKDPTSGTSSPELKEPATSSTGPSEKMLQKLMEAVATLSEEVQTLKNERGEKPRKMAAKADEIMEATQDRA